MHPRLKPLALAIAAALPWLALAAEPATDDERIVVTAGQDSLSPLAVDRQSLPARRAATSDAASLLRDVPGLSLYSAGGVSSLPSIHGLADDRIRTQVDGMDLIASCPNHMNSPLSYIDPNQVESVKVYAGISPVSVGGDSIGGTIQVNSAKPKFAAPGDGVLTEGQIGGFYRSNGSAFGSNLSATIAGESLSFYYRGSQAEAANYQAGEAFKNQATLNSTSTPGNKNNVVVPGNEVAGTRYKTENQEVGFAMRNNTHFIDFKVGIQRIPYEDYPNQRMDMLDNQSAQFNLRYLGDYDWGRLEARAYRQLVKHYMNFDIDKTSMLMPMSTESQTAGGMLQATLNLSEQDELRVGTEVIRYHLNDWWSPVPGSMMMSPNTNLNINDGQRDRYALYGEWESRFAPGWSSLLGIRHETVRTNTAGAASYRDSSATYSTDIQSFNAQDHQRTDNNWDMTLLARYSPSESQTYEGGYARKTRSPNLYERYQWATSGMSAIMNNYVGDGNGYVGNQDLKPEVAHTFSMTGDWHDPDQENWGFKASPYYTYVQDYIDAQRCTTSNCAAAAAVQASANQFIVLQYVNQSAVLYGLDLSGFRKLGSIEGYGSFTLAGLLNLARGQNLETHDNLYNLMPPNLKITLSQKLGAWSNRVEAQFVAGKNQVSATRNEIPTDAYSLLNLRSRYETKRYSVDVGIENVFDRYYQLPLGGAYTAQGNTMSQNGIPWGVAVPGMGRTLYTALNIKF